MSLRQLFASLVVVSSALVLAAPASASPGEQTASAAARRDRQLADAKVAMKGDAQLAARTNFNYRIQYLAYTAQFKNGELTKGTHRDARDAMTKFTDNASRTFAIPSNKGTVHSARDTQAALTAKAIVQAVGPKQAKSFAASLVSATKSSVKENSPYHSRPDIGHAYRFKRAVENVVALGVTKKN